MTPVTPKYSPWRTEPIDKGEQNGLHCGAESLALLTRKDGEDTPHIAERLVTMLPFEETTWAKPVAKFMIVATLVAEIIAFLWLRHYGPLDPPEVVALCLILIGVLPPNIHILRRKPGTAFRPSVQAGAMPLHK